MHSIRERRRDVVRRVRVDPHLDRRSEDEGLERRARLTACLRKKVELVLGAIRDHGRHSSDGTGLGADGDERCRRVGGLGEGAPDRLLREALVARLDRGVDPEAPGANRCGTVLLDQAIAHIAEEVRLADPAVEPPGIEPELRLCSARVLLSRDDPRVEHRSEDGRAAGAGARRRGERVVDRRRLGEPREKSGLRERQLQGRAGEERLRGSLDPVCLTAVVHLVQVRGQDPVLRPGVVELGREAGFLQLPLHRSLARDVEISHELLRDRRPALDDAARLDVRNCRAGDSLDVDAAVREEATVLDCNRGFPDPRGHALDLDRLAVALGRDRAQEASVRREEERVLADSNRAQRAQIARRPVGEDRSTTADAGRYAQ